MDGSGNGKQHCAVVGFFFLDEGWMDLNVSRAGSLWDSDRGFGFTEGGGLCRVTPVFNLVTFCFFGR